MRNISFMLTTGQVMARTKFVTRRVGWRMLRPGQELCAVEKGMGLKAGEKVRRLATIVVVDVRQETVRAMIDDAAYGQVELGLEGFADHPTVNTPQAFVDFFCRSHSCTPDAVVTRIQFRYCALAIAPI